MTNVSEKIRRRKRTIRIIIIVLILLLLACIGVGLYMLRLWKNGDRLNRETMFVADKIDEVTLEGNDDAADADAVEYEGKPTVKHNGKSYVLNDSIFSILFMGIDTDDDRQFDEIGVSAHQSDALILAAIDPDSNRLVMINIPRMTITDVQQLDPAFNYARTTKSPICIQYAFGDGKELSCTLTRDAVSRLFFNIPISRYISMNLDGLYAANDAIGGVTVTINEDLSSINRKMVPGAVYTLNGAEAEAYVRERDCDSTVEGSNMQRLKRQVQYYKAFFSTAKAKLMQDPMFAVNLYGKMGGSMQTDLSTEEMIYLSKVVVNMDIGDDNIFTLDGISKNEDFFVNDALLKDLLIDVFYTEVTP